MAQADAGPAHEGEWVRTNGLHIYYETQGSGEPLILLHGGTETGHMWQPHIPSFAEHFRVIAPDSRGHGQTDNPTGELSYRLMADDVAALIRALDLTKPLVCGYSDGGQIALELGMRHPGLARALVVGAAWYKQSELYLQWAARLGFETPGAVDFAKLPPSFIEYWKTTHRRDDDPGYWRTLLQHISTLWLTPLHYTPADFEEIAEPTLILMGDRDGSIPIEQPVEMYQLIPNAELAILPHATHMSALDSQLFIGVILDFLLRHRATAK